MLVSSFVWGVIACQKASALVIAAARAPMLASKWVVVAPGGGVAFALESAAAGVPEYRMIRGRVLLWASSRCSAISVVTSNKVRSRRPEATSAAAAVGTTYV